MNMQEKAQDMLDRFEYAHRRVSIASGSSHDVVGSQYVRAKDNDDELAESLAWDVHEQGKMLPDDYRYQFMMDSLEAFAKHDSIEDAWEYLDSCVAVYTRKLLEWVESDLSRLSWVDEAVENNGYESLARALAMGQYEEILFVAGIVESWLNEWDGS